MKNVFFGLVAALALIGCGGGGGGGSTSQKPRVSYINASPDAGNVNFIVNGSTDASDVPFSTATDFKDLSSAGDKDITVSGSDNGDQLWSEVKSIGANTHNLVLAVGLRNPPTDGGVTESSKRLLIYHTTIDRSTPVGNRARLFVVHAFVRQAGFGTPSIDFRNPGDTPVINEQGIDVGAARTVNVDSGAQTFQVRQNGTEQVFTEKSLTLAPGGIYVALVSGLEGTSGATAPDIRLIQLPTRD